MSNIEKLLIKRAQLIKQVKENKADSANGFCSFQSPYINQAPSLLHISSLQVNFSRNCIERAYDLSREISTPYDYFGFAECFFDLLGEDGEPACDHCKKVIENKRARGKLGRKLGGVNAALTRIGQRLERESI